MRGPPPPLWMLPQGGAGTKKQPPKGALRGKPAKYTGPRGAGPGREPSKAGPVRRGGAAQRAKPAGHGRMRDAELAPTTTQGQGKHPGPPIGRERYIWKRTRSSAIWA